MNYSSDIRKNKEFEILKSFIYNLVLSVFITLIVVVIGIFVFDLRMDIVVSESMTPAIMVDDVVVVKGQKEYKVNDVIEFKYNSVSKPVTHRIVEITTDEQSGKLQYWTKGDAVQSEDATPITFDNIIGKVIYTWEGGGKVYDFVKSNYFLFIDVLVGLWVLASVVKSEVEMAHHNIAKV